MLCAKQLVDSPDTMSLFLVPEIVSWSHSHSPDCSLACVHPFPLQTFGTDFGTATKTQTGRDRTSGPIHKQGRGRRLCGFGTGHYQTPEGVRRGKGKARAIIIPREFPVVAPPGLSLALLRRKPDCPGGIRFLRRPAALALELTKESN